MPTEADTCRTRITPALQAAGWESGSHSIAEQRTFTDGRIIVHGNSATRRQVKRADYILL
jgi:type I restriction enzyme R subunit